MSVFNFTSNRLSNSAQILNKIPIKDYNGTDTQIDEEQNGIKVEILHNKSYIIYGFLIEGETGYAELGSDILAAGISSITQNTINSIKILTNDELECEVKPNYIKCILPKMKDSKGSRETNTLLQSMVIGLLSIESSYGKEYININRIIE